MTEISLSAVNKCQSTPSPAGYQAYGNMAMGQGQISHMGPRQSILMPGQSMSGQGQGMPTKGQGMSGQGQSMSVQSQSIQMQN